VFLGVSLSSFFRVVSCVNGVARGRMGGDGPPSLEGQLRGAWLLHRGGVLRGNDAPQPACDAAPPFWTWVSPAARRRRSLLRLPRCAFIGGLRYGERRLYTKNAGDALR
jgi:hypothetical protein